MVYCGGTDTLSNTVIQYNPESGDWSKLPTPPVGGFAIVVTRGTPHKFSATAGETQLDHRGNHTHTYTGHDVMMIQ